MNAKERTTTDVVGLADLDLQIKNDMRVVDVDEITISVKNKGSKAATRILISGRHSPEVIIKRTAGTKEPTRYKQNESGKSGYREFLFPMIERLDVGKEIIT